jgi:hypothetical protein
VSEPNARGCLISCVLVDVAGANPRFRAERERRFLALETRIRDRLDPERQMGRQFGPQTEDQSGGDAKSRAILIASIARGLMLRARTGADRALLEHAATEAVDLLAPALSATRH